MIKRHSLGLTIAALMASTHEAFRPSSSCSIELLPSSMSQIPGANSGTAPYGGGITVRNQSTSAQAPAAATLTYLTGSNLAIPPQNPLRVGARFKWSFCMTKTAAGTATSTIAVVFGTAGTTADTARVSFTKPAGTAVIDEAWCEIDVTVKAVSNTVGVMVGTFRMTHGLENTGHAVIPTVVLTTVSGSFDNIVDNAIVGLVITTGAADAITIQQLIAQAWL
jgi:hypothetical protein